MLSWAVNNHTLILVITVVDVTLLFVTDLRLQKGITSGTQNAISQQPQP